MKFLIQDRTFKINNTWIGFHNNIKELTKVLGKNQFPSSLVNKTVKQYLSNFFASTSRTFVTTSSNVSRTHYLTIRPVARKGYGSIAHEAKPNGLLTRGP